MTSAAQQKAAAPQKVAQAKPESWSVVVVGAGPAGLAAACETAEAGYSTLLLDANAAPGGQIWRPQGDQPAKDALPWLARLRVGGAELRCGARVVDIPSTHQLWVQQSDSASAIRFERLILATGAGERFLPFPGWTLPGVFGAGGLQALVKGGLPVDGKRILVAGSGPLLAAVADALRQRGAEMVGLAEQASTQQLLGLAPALLRQPRKLAQLVGLRRRLLGMPWLTSTWPVRALGTDRLEAVELLSRGTRRTLAVDMLACGFGLVPETRLATLLGCRVEDGKVTVDGCQRTSRRDVFCAGEPTGIGGVDLALTEGRLAGLAAVGRSDAMAGLEATRSRQRTFADALERAFRLRPELGDLPDDATVVCRCEDVTWAALRHAEDARDAKLHSRCGMGSCQGRVCGPALETLRGWPMATPRPPLFPIPARFWRRPTEMSASPYSSTTTSSTQTASN